MPWDPQGDDQSCLHGAGFGGNRRLLLSVVTFSTGESRKGTAVMLGLLGDRGKDAFELALERVSDAAETVSTGGSRKGTAARLGLLELALERESDALELALERFEGVSVGGWVAAVMRSLKCFMKKSRSPFPLPSNRKTVSWCDNIKSPVKLLLLVWIEGGKKKEKKLTFVGGIGFGSHVLEFSSMNHLTRSRPEDVIRGKHGF